MNNVRDFGARGDGVTDDTVALQRTIDAGGIARFPPGTYYSGTLYLRSNGGLELEPGAVLLASTDPAAYNADDFCPQNQAFTHEMVSGAHLLCAVEVENVVIRGGGRIDGNGRFFFGAKTFDPEQPRFYLRPKWRPGQMAFFCESSRITVEGVEFYDAPYWSVFLHGCEDVFVRGVRIHSNRHTRMGDGLDIDCCRKVAVSDCIIDSGDDCITLRGRVRTLSRPRPCEWVTITNCVLRTPRCGVRVGVGTGVIRHCTLSNLVMHDTVNGIALCPRFTAGYTECIESISFDHIDFQGCALFKMCSFGWSGQTVDGTEVRPVRNLSFSRIRAEATHGSFIVGHQSGAMHGLRFDDVDINMVGGTPSPLPPDSDPEELWHRQHAITEKPGSPAPFLFSHIPELALENVRVTGCEEARAAYPVSAVFHACPDVQLRNCRWYGPIRKTPHQA